MFQTNPVGVELFLYACKCYLLCQYICIGAGHVNENALSFDARGKRLIYLNNAHCEAANRSPFPKSWETGTRLAKVLCTDVPFQRVTRK